MLIFQKIFNKFAKLFNKIELRYDWEDGKKLSDLESRKSI